jgi:hypothetical protein
MKTLEEIKRFGFLMKKARMVVMQDANTYTDKWHYCRPSQRIDEEVCFCVLGSSPALGFVVVIESKSIKAFDAYMNLLDNWEI